MESSTQSGGIRGMRRKQVATTSLIETEFLPGHEDSMPLVVRPAVDERRSGRVVRGEQGRAERLPRPLRRDPLQRLRPAGAPPTSSGSRRRSSPELFAEYGDLPQEATSRADLPLDAVSGRQDDPLPQRELAPAAVADAAVLLLRHPGAGPAARRRCSTAARSTMRSTRRSASSSRRRA